MLSIITLALDGGELLGSGPGRLIHGAEGQFILTRGLCGPQSQSGLFGGHRKYSPLPAFEPWDRPAHILGDSPTARVLYEILILGSLWLTDE